MPQGEDAIWSDERWLAPSEAERAPVIVILQPREHCDLGDLPPNSLPSSGR